MLGVVVLGVGVVDGRVCLRGHVVVLGLALPPSLMALMDMPWGLRYVRAGHHGRLASMPSQSALARDRATNV